MQVAGERGEALLTQQQPLPWVSEQGRGRTQLSFNTGINKLGQVPPPPTRGRCWETDRGSNLSSSIYQPQDLGQRTQVLLARFFVRENGNKRTYPTNFTMVNIK